MGNINCATVWSDGARRSIAMTSGPVSSEYGEAQVSARKTGITSLNIQEADASLGHRANIVHPESRLGYKITLTMGAIVVIFHRNELKLTALSAKHDLIETLATTFWGVLKEIV